VQLAARDYERCTDHHEAAVYYATIIQLSGRHANQHISAEPVQK
jgi:hypothetical protein